MLSFPTGVPAARQSGGVCFGTLNLSSKITGNSFVYAVLQGACLNIYETSQSQERGDFPVFTWFVVGASKLADITNFRFVTNQGTQVDCTTPTAKCRDLWVSALQSGLELSLQHSFLHPKLLAPPEPPRNSKPVRQFFRSAPIRYCKSCGSDSKLPVAPVTPLSQFPKSESRQDVCHDCSISQGLWIHLEGLVALYTAYDSEKNAHQLARDGCWNVAAAATGMENPEPTVSPSWVNVPSTPAGTTILLEYVQSTEFQSYCAKSPILISHRDALMNGDIGMSEFLERLDEVAGCRANVQASLKKQAFQTAGSDMGMAMKLLLEQAFSDDESTEVLQCVLEFFLNLCDESDLQSVAFFWPQLCQIHLRMLPATNAVAASRVDLFEDFLLTICVNYSIHLAMEIVWSHTADLEESMQVTTGSEVESCPAIPKKRRFSVLRFLCELESLLFDFEGGWGGGSVSVGKLLKPTPHQVQLLKDSAMQLRKLRPRNVLRRKRQEDQAEDQARRKYEIARNADYFTCHLNFSKRLSDIAEKLRLMEVQERSGALQQELQLLNSSGAMGGDPLNRVRKSLIRVVRVPSTEGHVFRSKERTPVLLLMEVIDEESVDKEDANELASANEPAASTSTEEKISEPGSLEAQDSSSFASAQGSLPKVESLDLASAESKDSSEHGEESVPKSSPSSMILEGAEEGFRAGSPGPKALLRFDSDGDAAEKMGQTPRQDVERLVNSVATEQLKEIIMPDISGNSKSGKEAKQMTAEEQKVDNDLKVDTSLSESKEMKALEKRNSTSKLAGMSATGSNDTVGDASQSLAPTGDIRRAVLTTIMMRGIQGNTIAAGTADSVQRSLKELERKRATELLMSDDDVVVVDDFSEQASKSEIDSTVSRPKQPSLGITSSTDEAELAARPSEEDEILESIRLILIQNQVAQGQLSPADAAKVLQHTSLSPINASKTASLDFDAGMSMDDLPTIDAGDVDPRLVGCGALPPAVLQAMTLWKGGMVSNAELLELVKKDMEFVKHSVLVDAANIDAMKENSAFWARFAFGERWAEKKARIGSSSPEGVTKGWDLMGVIVKSNDDLRQEAFVMQLIELCQEAFELAGLELWVSPYRILATGRTTGVIECVRNAMSFDALKKRPGYGKGGLREHLQRMAEFTADPGGTFQAAQQNFVRSLAAYSLISYLFLLKDRHNGNLLLDTAGHVIHIDFGFAFGIAPGGSFSLEMSTPFKLTEEMLDVMGGLRSPLFSEFVTLFCCGFLALQAHCDTFLTIIEITSRGSMFKCFEGRDTEEIVAKMRERLCPDLSKEDTVSFALDLIKQATTSYGTRQYDLYQYVSQGIVA